MKLDRALEQGTTYPLASHVARVLLGSCYPLSRHHLCLIARENECPKVLLTLLSELSDMLYQSEDDVQRAINPSAYLSS